MKKIFLLMFISLVMCSLSNKSVYAADNYEINIAVFCADECKVREFVRGLCICNFERGDFNSETIQFDDRFLEDETTGKENQVILYDLLDSTSYHTIFHIINPNDIPWNCGSLIKKCVGAIILYDISDPTLAPIINSQTFYREDLKKLIKHGTALNDCINFLQSWRCTTVFGWYNALEFITYGIENIEPDLRKNVHMQLNWYTCNLESELYGIDNKWSRGHPDVSDTDLRWKINPLSWIVGQAYRCIKCEHRNVYRVVPQEPQVFQGEGNDEPGFKIDFCKKKIIDTAGGVMILIGVLMLILNNI